jgi:iron complex outermembrane receptor protein
MKGTTLQFGGGEYGTITAAAIQAGTFKKGGYRLSFGEDQTNQWNKRDSLAFRNYKFNGQLEYNPDAVSRVTVTGGFFDTNTYDGPVLGEGVIHASSGITNGHANVLYERPNLFLRAWWQGWHHNQTNSADPSLARFFTFSGQDGNRTTFLTQNSYNVEGQHALEFSGANKLTYGFNYRYNTGSGNGLEGYTTENRVGLYVQDDWKILENLTAVAGMRMDMDTFINPTYSPRLALIYKPSENHSFRASGSVAYRTPTMFENSAFIRGSFFFPGIPPFVPPSTTPSTQVGNRNLSPEQIISYEVGYQGWYLKHRLRVRTDLYFNHLSDLINRVQAPGRGVIIVNGPGEADIHGLEAGLEFLATTWLTGFLNYNFESVHQTSSGPGATRAAPNHKINAGLRGDWANGLSGEAAVHYVSGVTYPVATTFATVAGFPFNVPQPNPNVPAYTLVNLRGGYKFWRDRAELAVSAFNALNDKHKEHPLGDVIGSRVLGWLTLKF